MLSALSLVPFTLHLCSIISTLQATPSIHSETFSEIFSTTQFKDYKGYYVEKADKHPKFKQRPPSGQRRNCRSLQSESAKFAISTAIGIRHLNHPDNAKYRVATAARKSSSWLTRITVPLYKAKAAASISLAVRAR